MRTTKSVRLACILLMLSGALAAAASAQTARENKVSYPAREIVITTPFAGPGAEVDVLSRLLYADAAPWSGQHRVRLVPLAANATLESTTQAINKDQTGHQLLLAHADALVAMPAFSPALIKPARGPRMLAMVATSPIVCVIPVADKSLDLWGWSKRISEARRVTIASAGVGSLSHVSAMLLMQILKLPSDKVQIAHVALGWEGKAVAAVQKGTAELACVAAHAALPIVRANRLRALLTTHSLANAKLQQPIPDAHELGLPQLQALVAFSGLAGADHLPASVIQWWQDQLKLLCDDPTLINQLAGYGTTLSFVGQERAQAQVNTQSAALTRLLAKYHVNAR